MADISTWSPTAAGNNFAVPDGFPEGMKRSDINNCMREYKAAIRRGFEDSQFFNYGDTPTRTGNTTFTVPGDLTDRYHAGRAIKCVDSSDLFGFIVSSVYSSVTTVTVKLVSGNLSASLTKVAPAIFTAANTSHRNLLYSEMRSISVDTTLDPSDMGGIVICTAAVRVTLPALAGFGFMRPSTVTIINRSGGTVTLISNGNTYLEKVGRFFLPANCGVTLFYTGDGKALRAVIDSDKTAPATKGINAISYSTGLLRNANPSNFGSSFICSFWAKADNSVNVNYRLFDRFDALQAFNSCFNVLFNPGSGTTNFSFADSTGLAPSALSGGFTPGTGWHNVIFTAQNSGATTLLKMWVDDTLTASSTFGSAINMGFNTNATIGADFTVANRLYWAGSLAGIYIAFNQFLDMTNVTNRRKIIDANGKAVYMGDDGSLVTGSAPSYYMNAPFDNPGQNLGTLGNPFSVISGTFNNATTYPSD